MIRYDDVVKLDAEIRETYNSMFPVLQMGLPRESDDNVSPGFLQLN